MFFSGGARGGPRDGGVTDAVFPFLPVCCIKGAAAVAAAPAVQPIRKDRAATRVSFSR